MAELTDREQEILELVRSGTNSPSNLAERLGISQSGASQALQRLAEKGKLIRRKGGRNVRYDIPRHSRDSELVFLFQAYNALSQVWAYIMSLRLTSDELQKAREARDSLEAILARKAK